MRKQLVIIGVIALLVCVGLSGCSSIGTTSMKDIMEHPNNYINKTVTLIAKEKGWVPDIKVGLLWDGDKETIYFIVQDNAKKPSPYIQGSEYKYTGIVRLGKPSQYPSDIEYIPVHLEVTKIETT